MNQIARIKEIVDWRNENIQEETYATHLAFDSIEQIIDSEETEINDVLLNNITAKEKFTFGDFLDELKSIIDSSSFNEVLSIVNELKVINAEALVNVLNQSISR